jgi:hypothetical protein
MDGALLTTAPFYIVTVSVLSSTGNISYIVRDSVKSIKMRLAFLVKWH